MDHIGQIITIVGACLIPIAGAFAMYLRALARNLGDNNRGQNQALKDIKKAVGLPVPPPSSQRRAKRESRFYPRAVTPLPFHPVPQPDDDKEA
jgi:hypothetical protein